MRSAKGASAEPLWIGRDLTDAMVARVVGSAPDRIGGVSIDTRTLAPGDAFFAIKGDNRDGHDFVKDALARGAAAAVVGRDRLGELGGAGPLLVVDDVLAALVRAGRAARARSDARIVAVTGSVGKTSTKEALRHALAPQGSTHASAASYNNHWGVPLSLARMRRDAAFGVFEIGMSAAGEIMPLVDMVKPHVAIITAIAPVHLRFFPSLDAIADAKAEIFSGIAPGGTAVINRDGPHFERLKLHAAASAAGRVVSFGEHEAADIRLLRAIAKPDMSIVDALAFGVPVTYRLGTPGRHLVLNSLAVLGAVHALGADIALAALSLAKLLPPVGRGLRATLSVGGGEVLLIDESYNANPASMRAAIEALGQAPVSAHGRRIAVLADMLELGPEAPRLHAALAADVEKNGIDIVFAAGPLSKNLYEALPPERRAHYAETADGLEAPLVAALMAGDTVMVKGSNSTRVSRLVAALRAKFPAPSRAGA
jgi:UDP-N-acetylmuramoyl-tripeptide--D-alanyl-D-alanine ligase